MSKVVQLPTTVKQVSIFMQKNYFWRKLFGTSQLKYTNQFLLDVITVAQILTWRSTSKYKKLEYEKKKRNYFLLIIGNVNTARYLQVVPVSLTVINAMFFISY